MECIDVERRFPTYKLGYEDHVVGGTQDPWLKVILCRLGSICPAGGSKLWACTDGRRNAASRAFIQGVDGVVVKMDGDDGVNAEFDVKDAATVFKIMKARRR